MSERINPELVNTALENGVLKLISSREEGLGIIELDRRLGQYVILLIPPLVGDGFLIQVDPDNWWSSRYKISEAGAARLARMSEPIRPEYEIAVLTLIADHNGESGWDMLDDALSECGIRVNLLPTLIPALASEGSIIIEASIPNIRPARFKITEAGLARIGRSRS